METKTIRIEGGVCGPMWWPIGVTGIKPVSATIDPMDRDNLYDELARILAANDGDFQGGDFTADTTITITHRRHGATVVTRSRTFEVADLPSVASLVNADVFTWDCEGDE